LQTPAGALFSRVELQQMLAAFKEHVRGF
jgi:hypothetical protein